MVEQHAFSLISFNKYLLIKHDIFNLFNIFIFFLTNFDRLGLKSFSTELPFDLFSLFFGVF